MGIQMTRPGHAFVGEMVPVAMTAKDRPLCLDGILSDDRILEGVGNDLVHDIGFLVAIDLQHHLGITGLLEPGLGIEPEQLAVQPGVVESHCGRRDHTSRKSQRQGSNRNRE